MTDANRLDIEDILGKLHDINNKLSGLDNIQSLLDRLKKLEDEMKDKLDRHEFDNEMAMIREMIGNIEADDRSNIKVKNIPGGSGHGGQFTAEEVKQLKSIIQKFPSLEEMIASITRDMKKLNINELREQLENI